MDDENGFVLLLVLAEQQGDEFEDELLARVELVCYGLICYLIEGLNVWHNKRRP